MATLALTRRDDRQNIMSSLTDAIAFNQGIATVDITAVGTHTLTGIVNLPANSRVVGGGVIVETAFAGGTAIDLDVGDVASTTRYLTNGNLKVVGFVPLIPTGLKNLETVALRVTLTTSIAVNTAGSFRLMVDYVVDGRTEQIQE